MIAVDPQVVLFATALATAIAGLFVASIAYRGYLRHESQTMRLLAIGIVLITAGPFLVSYGVAPLFALSDAAALLAILASNIAGLLAIIYSLET